MKVVINNCFGGFGLSPEATLELYKRGGPVDAIAVEDYYTADDDPDGLLGKNTMLAKWREYRASDGSLPALFIDVYSDDETLVLYASNADRANPILVKLVEEMGESANGRCSKLKVVEIPDGIDYEISEYDGHEHIAEKHRTWS